MCGAGGFRGGVLRGGFGGAVSTLARVGAPVVVALALLLQGEPPRDVVQLGRVGQVDKDLGTHTEL